MSTYKAVKVSAAYDLMGHCQQAVIDSINNVALESATILDELSDCDWSQTAGRIEALLAMVQAAATSMTTVDTINSIVDPE